MLPVPAARLSKLGSTVACARACTLQLLPLAQQFAESFDTLWITGEADQLYEKLLDEVQNGTGAVPIVYDAMALDWQRVTTLKEAIRAACTDVDSYDFRTYPEKHFTCSR